MRIVMSKLSFFVTGGIVVSPFVCLGHIINTDRKKASEGAQETLRTRVQDVATGAFVTPTLDSYTASKHMQTVTSLSSRKWTQTQEARDILVEQANDAILLRGHLHKVLSATKETPVFALTNVPRFSGLYFTGTVHLLHSAKAHKHIEDGFYVRCPRADRDILITGSKDPNVCSELDRRLKDGYGMVLKNPTVTFMGPGGEVTEDSMFGHPMGGKYAGAHIEELE